MSLSLSYSQPQHSYPYIIHLSKPKHSSPTAILKKKKERKKNPICSFKPPASRPNHHHHHKQAGKDGYHLSPPALPDPSTPCPKGPLALTDNLLCPRFPGAGARTRRTRASAATTTLQSLRSTYRSIHIPISISGPAAAAANPPHHPPPLPPHLPGFIHTQSPPPAPGPGRGARTMVLRRPLLHPAFFPPSFHIHTNTQHPPQVHLAPPPLFSQHHL